jgi:hypothetical protein
MMTFYKELTRRVQLKSVIWLHDGLWIPKEVPIGAISTAEQIMLHQLQLEQTPVFRTNDLIAETNKIDATLGDTRLEQNELTVLPDVLGRVDQNVQQVGSIIRWNTQAQSTGYETFVERTAKRRKKRSKRVGHTQVGVAYTSYQCHYHLYVRVAALIPMISVILTSEQSLLFQECCQTVYID